MEFEDNDSQKPVTQVGSPSPPPSGRPISNDPNRNEIISKMNYDSYRVRQLEERSKLHSLDVEIEKGFFSLVNSEYSL